MQSLCGNSFAHRMTLMSLLASSLAAGTLMVSFLAFDSISSRASRQSRLAALADVVEQNAELNFTDVSAAAEVLQAVRAEPSIIAACLYDASDQLFAQYQRQPHAKPCPQRLAQLPAIDGHPSAVRRVYRRGQLVGSLFLRSDLQELERRWERMLGVAGGLLLLALAVGGVAGSFLQRRISRPVSELARAMHNVTIEQNFDVRVHVEGNCDIAQLGRSFNTMLGELERRDQEKKHAETQLQLQALTDALTGLPNRRLFADRLSQTLALAGREGRNVALLYIDLDGFKLVNDSLGHAIGDLLLQEVAERLRTRVRQSDTLARLGGDEFTVILTGIHANEEAMLVARSLLDGLASPFALENHQLTVGASIGISIFPQSACDAADLMQQADSAMYAAKREGRNRAMFFTPELGCLVRERLNLENQLRAAVAHGEIHIHYQPEFDLSSHRLVRFEALARWIHPALGSIPPGKFIPVAEESGLIVSLGAYLMEMACAEAVKWQDLSPHPIQVAVNVSTLQFKRDPFVDEVIRVLHHTGLPPQLLQLELTESIMLSGVHRAADTMQRLRKLGVSLAIDDFGTGYSCLSYLPALPFDALKIDRSFVRDLDVKPEGEAMIHALISLARNIGMRVIVEGIETAAQLELVRKIGGNEIQGFLLGRPVADPRSMLAALFGDRRTPGAHRPQPTPFPR